MEQKNINQQLKNLFSFLNYKDEEITSLLTSTYEISLRRMLLEADKSLTDQEKTGINALVKKYNQTTPQPFWDDLLKMEKVRDLFFLKLQETVKEMLKVIVDNSTPQEQAFLQKKLQEIFS